MRYCVSTLSLALPSPSPAASSLHLLRPSPDPERRAPPALGGFASRAWTSCQATSSGWNAGACTAWDASTRSSGPGARVGPRSHRGVAGWRFASRRGDRSSRTTWSGGTRWWRPSSLALDPCTVRRPGVLRSCPRPGTRVERPGVLRARGRRAESVGGSWMSTTSNSTETTRRATLATPSARRRPRAKRRC